ncbi:MAG: cobyrinate a,c-diamide synthase [Hyphomicrobiales bacterium]|nr:cobyrinate a,c-diamide synthase [Hyphomicrobiales bacterium]
MIAAPCSGAGKSLITLCLLSGFARRGLALSSVKIGPDYIDAAFHREASGGVCVNLDGWAMRTDVLLETAAFASVDADLLLAEGVMGMFDGARDGAGSSADVAAAMGWNVVLVVDGRGTGRSIGALVKGFANFRDDICVGGVLLNRVRSPLHQKLLEEGCRDAGVEVLGAIPEDAGLHLPHRHLGLVQAAEHPDLKELLHRGAEIAEKHIDMDRMLALARPLKNVPAPKAGAPFTPPAQNIAVAKDIAFAFTYPSWFTAWRNAGAEVSFFSPLCDEAPREDCDFVFLPGGYPELHAERLANASNFLRGLQSAQKRGAMIYGECGGYIVLGEGLTDEHGERHAFAGLLPLETRFGGERTLGYRRARLLADGFLGAQGDGFRGHEFHFVAEVAPAGAPPAPLFEITPPDFAGEAAAAHIAGMRTGKVMGSFLHLIDRCASTSAGATLP